MGNPSTPKEAVAMIAPARREQWTVEDWVTVAIAPLPPGWINVFGEGDGRCARACPVVLLQEHRATTYCTHEGSRTEREPLPYYTRTVYADLDWVNGTEAACEMSNYVGTEYQPGA
jgi:hypothetical protein